MSHTRRFKMVGASLFFAIAILLVGARVASATGGGSHYAMAWTSFGETCTHNAGTDCDNPS